MDKLKKRIGVGNAIWLTGVLLSSTSNAAVILADSPDIKIRDASNQSIEAVGAEPTVVVHPDNWRILLMGLIAQPTNGSSGWFSTDGGIQWHGDNERADPTFDSDPTVAILKGSPTRYLIQSNVPSTEQWVTWTDTASPSWADDARISNSEESTDKAFLCADNSTASPFFGQLYSLWSRPNGGLYFRYSLASSRGGAWLPQPDPIPLRITNSTWGGVISVGIAPSTLGEVYVAWPNAASLHNAPGSMSFKRSDNGGVTFPTTAIQITGYPGGSFAPRASVGLNTGANSIPTMAADDLGNIYVAWCQKRQPTDGGPGADAQLYVSKSSDHGNNWGTPVPVTASTWNQWLPWIAWDDEAKVLAAVYFDDRDDANRAEVYLAASYDRGGSFVELRISDASGTGDVFVGDYIGIACGGGIAYPVWCDDRESGIVKAFISPILIGGIDSGTISATVGQSCAGIGNPRVRFQADWATLATMDGVDKLTVTPPGQSPVTVTATSTSNAHQLILYDLPCMNGTWTYTVESNKGSLVSQSGTLTKSVTCMSCPPPCHPPCELE